MASFTACLERPRNFCAVATVTMGCAGSSTMSASALEWRRGRPARFRHFSWSSASPSASSLAFAAARSSAWAKWRINAGYHKSPDVKVWLAEHPRFAFHFTPTHASWLNQVECWFSILSRKILRRGAHENRADLTRALLDYIEHWNTQAHPFDWAYGEELIHDSSIAA